MEGRTAENFKGVHCWESVKKLDVAVRSVKGVSIFRCMRSLDVSVRPAEC